MWVPLFPRSWNSERIQGGASNQGKERTKGVAGRKIQELLSLSLIGRGGEKTGGGGLLVRRKGER